MGNAPLHTPPDASSNRAVLVMKTDHALGISLKLLQNNIHRQQRQDDEENRRAELPFALGRRDGLISSEEYNKKLSDLQTRIGKWRGGVYANILVAYSVLVIFGFVIAHLIPSFWESDVVDDHGGAYLYAFVVFQIIVLFTLVSLTRREYNTMQKDVEDMYGPWRERGINVSMKQVQSIGKYYELITGQKKEDAPSGCHAFCVIFDIDNDEERNDDGSVGTVQTELVEEEDFSEHV